MNKLIMKWTGFSRVQDLLTSMPDQDGVTFVERAATEFQVSARHSGLPQRPVHSTIFLCTHHTGALDFLASYPALSRIAPNLKVIVNNQLLTVPPLAQISIGVFPLSQNKSNEAAKDQMAAHLALGGNILLYPAGKVGFLENGQVTDAPWRPGIASLITETGINVIPVYVDATNSKFFYLVRRFFPKLSMLFLLRSLKGNKNNSAHVYIGQPINKEQFNGLDSADIIFAIRKAAYALKPTINPDGAIS